VAERKSKKTTLAVISSEINNGNGDVEFVLRFVLSDGFLYRKDCLGIPRACRAWNNVLKTTPLSLAPALEIIKSQRHQVKTTPAWLTEEKQAILKTPEFIKKVYQKINQCRIDAKRTKREGREAAQNTFFGHSFHAEGPCNDVGTGNKESFWKIGNGNFVSLASSHSKGQVLLFES